MRPVYWFISLTLLMILHFNTQTINAQTACEPVTNESGLTEQTITIDDDERRYLLYIPDDLDLSTPAPLVLSMHGFASSAQMQVQMTEWNDMADEASFVVAYPQGAGLPPRWNNGISDFIDEDNPIDREFLSTLIESLTTSLCLDSTRVYATGFSAGGGMAHRLACEIADQVTAIGTVGGAYSEIPGGCDPIRPVPVISFHGDSDSIVPYEGQGTLPPIETWASDWAARDECTDEATITQINDEVREIRYAECAEGTSVVLFTIAGGGHTWPGGGSAGPEFLVGLTSTAINATETMWAFFEGFSLESAE